MEPPAATPVVHPFIAGGTTSDVQPQLQPQVQEQNQDVGQERDLPIYEEIASGSQVKQGALSVDRKGQ